MHWIKYHEHASVLPVNFVALGDALLKMNPVFGQGMAKTMVEAITLDAVLRSVSASSVRGLGIGPIFFKKLVARTSGTWKQVKFGDYAHEGCEPVLGETRDVGANQRAFNSRFGRRALKGDKDIQRRMMGMRAWVLPPTDAFAPSVLAKLAMDWVLGR
jgi:hypothetical protein